MDGGVDGEDDLANLARGDARDEALDVQIVGADAVERRQRAAEHVVAGAECCGALQRPQVGDILDDDQCGRIAARVGADRAGIDRGKR